jgi:hypothetical protein
MKRHPFFVDAFFMYKCYQALNKKFDFSQIKFYWLFRILNWLFRWIWKFKNGTNADIFKM